MLTHYWHRLTEEDIRKRIQVIHHTATNSFKLLENLLQWARSQTGNITINPTLVDLKALIEETVSFLQNNAQSKNIKLNSDIKNSILVKTDSNMTITVLRNLISNAIKFTPQNGSVFISARECANDVEVTIADTGLGIEEKRLKEIFRIDAHSKSTRGTDGEIGTGLGLILCKEFVEKNGGEIWVETELGKGSVFKFTLPRS
jgi:signal transduction histidine kinase